MKQHYMTTKADLTDEIKFENTLLRNGIVSPSVEEKLANIYDLTLRDTADHVEDSLLDSISIYSTSDLAHSDESNKTKNEAATDTFENKNSTADCTIGNVCLCVYQTSTPVRLEFDPYSELFPKQFEGKIQTLQTLEDNLKEMKMAEDLLAETLARKECVKMCFPKLKKSLKRVRKSSKKGAISALTIILTNIV